VRLGSVLANRRKRAFEVRVGRRVLPFPFVRCAPPPTREDPVLAVAVDPEIGREGFTYRLASGREGTIHAEQVLEYNKDPGLLREQILYRLTLEAQKRIERSSLSRREVVRRLGTSATQLYRLLDPTNTRKSVDHVLRLLHVLDCDVELTVRGKGA
jgi:hypothetical protein